MWKCHKPSYEGHQMVIAVVAKKTSSPMKRAMEEWLFDLTSTNTFLLSLWFYKSCLYHVLQWWNICGMKPYAHWLMSCQSQIINQWVCGFTVRPTSPLQIHFFCNQDGNSGKTPLEPLKWVVRNQWVTSQYLRQSIKLSMSSIEVYRKAILSWGLLSWAVLRVLSPAQSHGKQNLKLSL